MRNQVPNKVEIYYHNKLLKHHSIGQRASALILFILMQSDNDIILIDQPEDDLDNKIIYDEVITAIKKKKQKMQFVFATHNSNIPVLGDAERILWLNIKIQKLIYHREILILKLHISKLLILWKEERKHLIKGN